LLGVFASRDNRRDATSAGCLSVGLAVLSLVFHCDAQTDAGANVEQLFEFPTVAGLASGQVEVERVAVEIGLEVDFGRETAARAFERLMMLPPFAPAAET
jgi:hypothetical protein